MAAAAVPLILGAISAGQKADDAKFAEGQAEIAASQQELQLTQREADRKQRLASSLASQNVLAGASGIRAFEGSPLTILQDSIETEERATGRDVFSTELNVLAGRSTARARRRASEFNAGLTLLDTVNKSRG